MYKPLLALLLLLDTGAFAQGSYTLVDRDQVKKESGSKNYRKLIERFEAFDSTLTLADYRLIYYGAVFQKSFLLTADETKKEINQALEKKDYKEVNELCDKVLSKKPTSLAGNFYKGLALFGLYPDSLVYTKYRDRYTYLLKAILSSGDGLTCGTGFRVNTVADEYTIIYNWFRIRAFMGQSLIDHCDLLHVKPSDEWPKDEIYFDASEILRQEDELLFGHH